MTLKEGDLLLLDTSIVVDIAVNNASGKAILESYALLTRADRPLMSVITVGEMYGIARLRGWRTEKLDALKEILTALVRVDVTDEVIGAYADLVALCRAENHTMGQQNDLWIAASARAAGAILLTGDDDFNWLNGTYARVEYVPRNK